MSNSSPQRPDQQQQGLTSSSDSGSWHILPLVTPSSVPSETPPVRRHRQPSSQGSSCEVLDRLGHMQRSIASVQAMLLQELGDSSSSPCSCHTFDLQLVAAHYGWLLTQLDSVQQLLNNP